MLPEGVACVVGHGVWEPWGANKYRGLPAAAEQAEIVGMNFVPPPSGPGLMGRWNRCGVGRLVAALGGGPETGVWTRAVWKHRHQRHTQPGCDFCRELLTGGPPVEQSNRKILGRVWSSSYIWSRSERATIKPGRTPETEEHTNSF